MMSDNRLGELTEQELKGMMDFVLSDEFDQMSVSEFFGSLKAMDEADAPERVVVRGHVEGGQFLPDIVEGGTLEGRRIRVNKKSLVEILVEAA